MNYKVDMLGMCLGVGIMGIFGILTEELAVFDERAKRLAEKLEESSEEELVQAIHQIEEKRVNAIAGYKRELLRALKLPIHLSDNSFYRLIKSKEFKNNPFVLDYKRKYNAVDSILTDEERQLADAHAFLEDVCVAYFASLEFPDLYKQADQLWHQDITVAMQRVLPHSLVEKPNLKGIRRFKKISKSLKKERSLIEKVDTFTGIYDVDELTGYLLELYKIAGQVDGPVAFALYASGHMIVLSFDKKTRSCCIIDPNKLPSERFTRIDLLAEALFDAYKIEERVTLVTEVICKKNISKSLKQVITNHRKQPEWKELHTLATKETFYDDKQTSLLIKAARFGDVHVFKELLELDNPPIDINQLEEEGVTAFNMAVVFGQREIIKLIMKDKNHKPDLNILHQGKRTALSTAIFSHDIKMVKLLLKMKDPKVDVNQLDADNRSAIYHAAKIGDLRIVKLLLKAGADIELTDKFGDTPLHAAAFHGHLDVVEELISKKATISGSSRDGNTPLLLAISNGKLDVVEALLKHQPIDPTMPIFGNISPLYKAVQTGNVTMVRSLLDSELIKKPLIDATELLAVAVRYGHIEIVNHLLSHPKIKENHIDANAALFGAMRTAIEFKKFDIMTFLLESKNHNVKLSQIVSDEGLNILHLAILNQNTASVTRLLEYKEFHKIVNDKTDAGISALMIAIHLKNRGIVTALIKAGAIPTKADQLDMGAMFVAKHRASPQSKRANKENITPNKQKNTMATSFTPKKSKSPLGQNSIFVNRTQANQVQAEKSSPRYSHEAMTPKLTKPYRTV